MANRYDTTGFFWDDYVAPRIKLEKIKREPPDPVWLSDNYLPDLAAARAYKFDLMTTEDIMVAHARGDRLVWDCEFYPNYTLVGFKHLTSGKIIKFEFEENDTLPESDKSKLRWIMSNFIIIGFNDTAFDIPMAMAVLAGFNSAALAQCADDLINGGEYNSGMRATDFYRQYKLKPFYVNNIDLIQLTPLGPGLKVCAGRLHSPRMADLPYPAGKYLSPEQKTILRWYWTNDLANTELLYKKHGEAIALREILTSEYGVDVRSKSDPQIAEAVIRAEIRRITKQRIQKAEIQPGRWFRYKAPSYVQFQTPLMRDVLSIVTSQPFVIDEWGSPMMPDAIAKLKITLGNSTYQMGIGGLHSTEKRMIHFADDNYELTDNDVTSYYPELILQQGMFPPHIGPVFLQVFQKIVTRRIAAKRAGDKGTAETLKIVVNGTFGKTGERGGHSVVYYPEMMIQVTLSGQLSLLMLIEILELNGIEVVSANTDGVMIKCPRSKLDLKKQIIEWWQATTGLELETSPYKAIFSRDVNNYIAIYETPQKGQVAKRIGAYRETLDVYPLKWNPTCDVCSNAVTEFLANQTPIEQTIRAETDVRKFIEVRRVTTGAAKDGEFLGKVIRWYYAKNVDTEILNVKSGYVVPRSLGAKPCMILPTSLPEDIDYEYYIQRAENMLVDLGVNEKAPKASK